MAQVIFYPQHLKVELDPAETLLQGLAKTGVKSGLAVESPCGGRGKCGRCQVHIVSGKPAEPTAAEQATISGSDLELGVRLACQCTTAEDLEVLIPPESLSAETALQVDDKLGAVGPDPVFQRIEIALSASALGKASSCWDQVLRALAEKGFSEPAIDYRLMQKVQPLVASGDYVVIMQGSEVIDFHHAQEARPVLGLAVDFGSTKVAGYLLNLETGEVLGANGLMNPQVRYGADVVSRIARAQSNSEAAKEIQDLSSECLHHLADLLTGAVGRSRQEIVQSAIVANTAMHHLVLGLPVKQLGCSPYLPATTSPIAIKSRELELDFAPGAMTYFTPSVAGYVGGDHVAMILACGLHQSTGVILGLDIGTNTELVLAKDGKLWSASCASGPAFEGSNIRQGMRAVEGAVWKVWADQDQNFHYQTIGDILPLGICGSGMVDAVVALRKTKLISAIGSLDRKHPRVRLRENSNEPEFVLAAGEKSGIKNGVTIGQRDIVAIQLAKAAIGAGIEMLLDAAGVSVAELDRIVIAGAFGSHLDPASAVGIGLLPDIPLEKIVQVGNAAGAGAKMSLVSRKHRLEAEELAARINYLELAGDKRFSSFFTQELMFPDNI
jgi:uncharacterized 2Fe-2S/4Fe-4S cluster protein (DUF4445 family)